MRRTVQVLTLTAFLAATATAATMIDERFENGVPPPLWTQTYNSTAIWTAYAGGPWGYYARAGATVSSMSGAAWANLDTYAMAATAGQTFYYRFMYLFYRSPSLGHASGEFTLYVVNTGSVLGSWNRESTNTEWEEASGSIPILSTGSVKGRFRFYAGTPAMGGLTARFSVDTFQIGNTVFTAVAPASLGKVKALYW